jgi:3-deoxy-manno-octulosonate cytidylyltransferase (CMP-KDO synthetase)
MIVKNARKENTLPRAVGVIPARWGATRFPGKLLARLGDRTVIEHVYRRAEEAEELDSIWVATDDARILREVERFGGRVIMTSSAPRTGTERTAEACRGLEAEIVVNIQGDEPFLRPGMIDSVVRELVSDPALKAVTLVSKTAGGDWMDDPNQVKTVLDRDGFALYFSRSPIPSFHLKPPAAAFRHIGLYGYRGEFLNLLVGLKPGPLEIQERLEQLRVLENGYRMKALETDYDTIGIDTPADLDRARVYLKKFTARTQKTQRSAKKY